MQVIGLLPAEVAADGDVVAAAVPVQLGADAVGLEAIVGGVRVGEAGDLAGEAQARRSPVGGVGVDASDAGLAFDVLAVGEVRRAAIAGPAELVIRIHAQALAEAVKPADARAQIHHVGAVVEAEQCVAALAVALPEDVAVEKVLVAKSLLQECVEPVRVRVGGKRNLVVVLRISGQVRRGIEPQQRTRAGADAGRRNDIAGNRLAWRDARSETRGGESSGWRDDRRGYGREVAGARCERGYERRARDDVRVHAALVADIKIRRATERQQVWNFQHAAKVEAELQVVVLRLGRIEPGDRILLRVQRGIAEHNIEAAVVQRAPADGIAHALVLRKRRGGGVVDASINEEAVAGLLRDRVGRRRGHGSRCVRPIGRLLLRLPVRRLSARSSRRRRARR